MLSTTHSHSEPNLNYEKDIKEISDVFRNFKRSFTILDDDLLFSKSHSWIDEVDNGNKSSEQNKLDTSDSELFKIMRYEANRLFSFKNKWPCNYINTEDLAEAGFFYLQSEGKVQCPFCGLTVSSWECGDKPLREHMKKSPKCPFLLSVDDGNIPIVGKQSLFQCARRQAAEPLPSSSVSYKPKHPKMSDIQRRLYSFKNWPLKAIQPLQLAKCGLYYTGVSDVVTCFFCGGSLGNWEENDDPYEEHSKHFGHCIFLSLAKNEFKKSAKTTLKPPVLSANQKLIDASLCLQSFEQNSMSDIYKQACEIFTESLVSELISKYKITFKSLPELCEKILRYKDCSKESIQSVKPDETACHNLSASHEKDESNAENRKIGIEQAGFNPVKKENLLLCKICMDHEMEVAFQPCGHLLSCQKCSHLLFNCPMCRKPILSKERIYVAW